MSSPPKTSVVVEPAALPERARPRRTRRYLLWILFVLLLVFIVWVAASDSPLAQQMQEFVGFKQDRPILDSSFTVGPHTFRYYKFALPEGSVNVAVVGQFNSSVDSQVGANHKSSTAAKNKDMDIDNNIEVYILSETAFTVWQNGYATSSVYESGKVAEGNVQSEVPAGAGIYYLVLSNKFAPKTSKTVHATVLLRYKSWLPDWVRRMKGRFMDWVGLN